MVVLDYYARTVWDGIDELERKDRPDCNSGCYLCICVGDQAH